MYEHIFAYNFCVSQSPWWSLPKNIIQLFLSYYVEFTNSMVIIIPRLRKWLLEIFWGCFLGIKTVRVFLFQYIHALLVMIISETENWPGVLATLDLSLQTPALQTLACIRITENLVKTASWTSLPEVNSVGVCGA